MKNQSPQKIVVRMDIEVYRDLERKVTSVTPVVPTTELAAGFRLGAQHVLQLLRDGYVIGA